MTSSLSLLSFIPAYAIVVPGANPAGFSIHLCKSSSFQSRAFLDDRAAEYLKPAPEAIFLPKAPQRAGPIAFLPPFAALWQFWQFLMKSFLPLAALPGSSDIFISNHSKKSTDFSYLVSMVVTRQ